MKSAGKVVNKIKASKVLIFIILLLLDIFLYVGAYHFLYNRITFLFGSFSIISILLIIMIINSESNTSYKISWIVLVLAFQGGGALLYIYVHFDTLYKNIKNHYRRTQLITSSYLHQDKMVKMELKKESPTIYGMSKYADDICGYPTYKNTECRYFKIGEEYFEALLDDLKKAEKFILIEYFIINNTYMWQSVLNILLNKVKEGIEVRVMYDGFGSLLGLPPNYDAFLERNGIKAAVFSEVRPFLSIHQNNRDHRKIVVIDGKVGYTGGINLSDEYINRTERFGHWKDTGIRLEGEAVNSLTMMFFEIWQSVKRDYIEYKKYLINYKVKSDGYIMPYSDSPFNDVNLAEDIYLNILNTAVDYVYITTPYLILDDHLLKALDNAVKRGVKVKIILPHIPDKNYVYCLAVSHYKSLIKRGVEIYEYTPGFIHAKSFLSDDTVGVVGTVNLDYRSLYLHFECGVQLYKSKVLEDLKVDFENTIFESIKVDEKYIKKIPIYKKIMGRLLKIFAPLM